MLRALIVCLLTFAVILLIGFVGSFCFGFLRPAWVAARRRRQAYRPVAPDQVAILIACRNGETTIGGVVKAARANGVPVYVVSDASTDATVEQACAAGAHVLPQPVNIGKPAALYLAYAYFRLGQRFRAVAILDDDVLVGPTFVAECLAKLAPDVGIVVGHNVTWWPPARRWNAWLAARAYSYWYYQLVIRRLQSATNVMNCISGSNSLYRTELLDQVLPKRPPYIVDDTFWVLEAHRRKLGRVTYAPRARALLQDPTTFRDWYRQNLRWMWGTYQGIIGHRVGRRVSRFDVAYLLLMLHWAAYVFSAPVVIWAFATSGAGWLTPVLLVLAGYATWTAFAAVALRRPRLLLFIPALVVIDLIYRAVMVHALVKAIRQPTVARCVWTSPARLANQ